MRSALPLLALPLAIAAPALATEIVPVPQFRSVELRGGGDVTLVRGPVQRVTVIAGSTQFTRLHVDRTGKLRIDACNGRCPRNYDLRIRIESPRAPDVAIQGGGRISASPGFAPQADLAAAVSGGGQIELRAISVANATAAVNGGGQISMQPRNSLMAAVSGGGLIRYSGNPRVSSAVMGGGSVIRSD